MSKQTSVVCVKAANIRPKYNSLKEWIEDNENNPGSYGWYVMSFILLKPFNLNILINLL